MSSQRGNILFLILIAVALFAALSYAVTSSTRSGSGDTKSEDAQLKAAQYLQYGAALKLAVDRMIISGIQQDQIKLHDASFFPCTSGSSCVFSPDGGKISELKLKTDPEIDLYGNQYGYKEFADGNVVEGVGTAAPEIVFARSFTFNEKGRKLCEAINKGMGVEGVPMTGPYVANTYNAVSRAPVLCFQYFTTEYIFYYVLHGN